MKLTFNERRIVNLIKHSGLLTSGELAQKMGNTQRSVQRSCRDLVKKGVLNKAGWKYGLANFDYAKPKSQPIRIKVNVTPQKIHALLERWAAEGWNPKIFNTARALPVGLAQVYELALAQLHGEKVTPAQLLEPKQRLTEFKRDLQAAINVVNSLLDEESLWDKSAFAEYLLESLDEDSLDSVGTKVEQIKSQYS